MPDTTLGDLVLKRPTAEPLTAVNSATLLEDPQKYFAGAYEEFVNFGGPCLYFHRECLRAGAKEFLSERHIEMLYATLTAWGMHRMGDAAKTKTRLTEWAEFRESLAKSRDFLEPLRGVSLLGSSEREYSAAVSALEPCYRALRLSESNATVVVNSKALFHLLPNFTPPIDRQYTVRFFTRGPEKWRDASGKFRPVPLPAGLEAQFELFRAICVETKRLADQIDPALFETELSDHDVTPPKAIDNAIVNYVRIVSDDTTRSRPQQTRGVRH